MNKVQELETDTKTYWIVSSMFNGQIESQLSVEGALNKLNSILDRTSSLRPLAKRANILIGRIVNDNVAPKKSNTSSNKSSVTGCITTMIIDDPLESYPA
jgi:hypothetical protein